MLVIKIEQAIEKVKQKKSNQLIIYNQKIKQKKMI